ncbi:hypothetical protein PO909_007399 [Leuciscus waleckii]
MEAADTLCDSLFCWLDNRKECAGELEKLAQKLKDVHEGSNIGQGVLAAAIVASSGAALALAKDQTTAKVAAAAVCTLAGAAVRATSTLVETLITSRTFKKAIKLIKEDEEVGTKIQKQLQDLKDRCAEPPLGTHDDELDCEVTTLLMSALARRSNTPVSLDLLRGFNRATFFRHMTPGGLDPAEASDFICRALGLDPSPEITSSLKVSAKEMMKNIELIGIKAVAKAESRALVATGFGMSLYDLIVKSKELVKGNRVTEASKFLRDSAREILDGQQKLKEQLDAMHEIIHKLFRMKRIIKNLGEYSLIMDENVKKIMAYIMGTCTDSTVLSWLQGLTRQNEFVNLLRFFLEKLSPIFEDLSKPGGGHIDIVFVAHGGIVDQFMPAGGLVPTPNIRDTILYSPWNCAIDSSAAFAIAQGFIQVTDREFYNNRSTPYCQPIPLRNHWNSMRESLHDIPGILLSPVTPEDGAWASLYQFWKNRDVEIEDRVIIPYLFPQNQVKAFGVIPLYMFIFATSFILSIHDKSATVHLAACLGRDGSPARPVEWVRQYAYTSDGTFMTVNLGNRNMDSELFTALKSLFDTNRR